MNKEYYKKYEPIFGTWYIKDLIGEGSFGKVYTIERTDFGKTYKAALKVITIPQNKSEIKSIMSEGMDEKSVTSYFKGIVNELAGEFEIMSGMKGTSNVVSYEDHIVYEHKDEIGWDILIRMELLTPLVDYVSKNDISEYETARLGIEICKALELCKKHNIIHRDIKPENIFISENGDYKLGDFGIARKIEKTTGMLSKKGTESYMAPEVYRGEDYGASVDIYSLGMVLYRLMNKNRLPFMPPAPEMITHREREIAIAKRMKGEKPSYPVSAGKKLSEIILEFQSFCFFSKIVPNAITHFFIRCVIKIIRIT